ncbi:hypothetical protein LCGC14_1558420 [marine sediment metagenome]|uniref:Uncharacterized protein n=1 Tax=marine sediment metagenome TaxID=412755 RepID=A0A0F9INB0_9ZZZZ
MKNLLETKIGRTITVASVPPILYWVGKLIEATYHPANASPVDSWFLFIVIGGIGILITIIGLALVSLIVVISFAGLRWLWTGKFKVPFFDSWEVEE